MCEVACLKVYDNDYITHENVVYYEMNYIICMVYNIITVGFEFLFLIINYGRNR